MINCIVSDKNSSVFTLKNKLKNCRVKDDTPVANKLEIQKIATIFNGSTVIPSTFF